MVDLRQDTYDVGVIVGRFQVPELHPGHVDLIESVCKKHDKVLIFLGQSPVKGTVNNPLDWESRKQMILERFPRVNVLGIEDCHSDVVWSIKLDQAIVSMISPRQSVILYGSRDSFIEHYAGKFPTGELESIIAPPGTEIREAVARRSTHASQEFRSGAIWAAFNRFPTCFTTVDVLVFNADYTQVLLGRKPGEHQFRLFGGFADPGSTSFEDDAIREVQEEACVSVTDLTYVGSSIVDDWRYRGEQDVIKTLVYVGTAEDGTPKACDDIEEVRWFNWDEINPKRDIMPNHRPLLELIMSSREKISAELATRGLREEVA